MASTAAAKAKYSHKVCANYLGISTAGCDRAFADMLANMRRGYEALKRQPLER